jgi:hypothetical protein
MIVNLTQAQFDLMVLLSREAWTNDAGRLWLTLSRLNELAPLDYADIKCLLELGWLEHQSGDWVYVNLPGYQGEARP